VEHDNPDPVSARRVLITGAAGQLGAALAEAFAGDDVSALRRAEWDVTLPAPPGPQADPGPHGAAWTRARQSGTPPVPPLAYCHLGHGAAAQHGRTMGPCLVVIGRARCATHCA